MDKVINSELVQKLRKEKSWTQDQLATVSGMSLRTIQRIEKNGACSLESIQALASVFEVEPNALHVIADEKEVKDKYQSSLFWEKAWNGGLPLRKAIILIWLPGLAVIILIPVAFHMLGIAMPLTALTPVLLVHGIFSANSIWRSSPNAVTTFTGIFFRLFILVYCIYLLIFTYKTLF